MVVRRPVDEYLQKARDAEECARNTTDSEMRASWCGIAYGYRELARFRKEGGQPLVKPSPDVMSEPGPLPHQR